MKIIGITGKSGSGKTTIASAIAKKINGIHLDIDKIGHEVLEDKSIKEKLIEAFGDNILTNFVVDRKKLGKIVFKSKYKMGILTDITWPSMEKMIDKTINSNQEKIIILDVPMCFHLQPKTILL